MLDGSWHQQPQRAFSKYTSLGPRAGLESSAIWFVVAKLRVSETQQPSIQTTDTLKTKLNKKYPRVKAELLTVIRLPGGWRGLVYNTEGLVLQWTWFCPNREWTGIINMALMKEESHLFCDSIQLYREETHDQCLLWPGRCLHYTDSWRALGIFHGSGTVALQAKPPLE